MKTQTREIIRYKVIPIVIVIIFCLGMFFQVQLVSASVPKIEPYVNDFAHLLTNEQISSLNSRADIIEQNTSWEIAMVTVTSTEGDDRTIYSNKIGDENGVGKKDKDNGLVILWSVDNEHGGAIATGRYSESLITDAYITEIGMYARTNYFDKEDYYGGFNYLLDKIWEKINQNNQVVGENETSSQSNNSLDSSGDNFFSNYWWIFLIMGIIFFVIIIKGSSSDSSSSSGSGGGFISSGRSSSSGGGSSFGGGGWGGGGGHF